MPCTPPAFPFSHRRGQRNTRLWLNYRARTLKGTICSLEAAPSSRRHGILKAKAELDQLRRDHPWLSYLGASVIVAGVSPFVGMAA
jgi:hypothetical protein